ncbi:MAG: hypothetical protein HUJ79_03640 [Firmicutes bacterium]|nr:hypothetical protein [Bacillota bacterium]
MQYFEFVHSMGLHAWDLPAVAVGVLMVIIGIVHWRKQVNREKNFQEEMNEKGGL